MEIFDNITVGQIASILTFVVGLIGGIAYVRQNVKKWISNALREQFASIELNQVEMKADIKSVDMNGCKDYLVRFLSDVESGQHVDEIEKERFFERYQHYTENGGNSYIRSKVENLKKAGKL